MGPLVIIIFQRYSFLCRVLCPLLALVRIATYRGQFAIDFPFRQGTVAVSPHRRALPWATKQTGWAGLVSHLAPGVRVGVLGSLNRRAKGCLTLAAGGAAF